MIKGIILDVDGVIIGSKRGVNFPFPDSLVITALQRLQKNGLSISLCTAKPGFAIRELVQKIGLKTIHIANGGAEIINPIKNVVKTHSLESDAAIELVQEAKRHKLYTEVYTTDHYALEQSYWRPLTDINISILGTKPHVVESLEDFVAQNKITKIMHAAHNRQEKELITKMVMKFPTLQLQWGGNPMYAPILFAVVTQKGITKKTGAQEISTDTGISFKHMLGIGDGMSDWEFMQLCEYVATVENADNEVKDLVRSRGTNGHIGPSVDENGLLDIFKYYHLD